MQMVHNYGKITTKEKTNQKAQVYLKTTFLMIATVKAPVLPVQLVQLVQLGQEMHLKVQPPWAITPSPVPHCYLILEASRHPHLSPLQ